MQRKNNEELFSYIRDSIKSGKAGYFTPIYQLNGNISELELIKEFDNKGYINKYRYFSGKELLSIDTPTIFNLFDLKEDLGDSCIYTPKSKIIVYVDNSTDEFIFSNKYSDNNIRCMRTYLCSSDNDLKNIVPMNVFLLIKFFQKQT